jgi:hypothetical protein
MENLIIALTFSIIINIGLSLGILFMFIESKDREDKINKYINKINIIEGICKN